VRGQEDPVVFNGDIPRVLLRRWYLVVLGLVGTAGLVLLALRLVAPTYTLTSEVVMLPPVTAVVTGDNPYLNLSGLESVGDVAAKAVTDDRTKLEVQERFGEVEYGVGLDNSAAAPIIVLRTESESPATTRAVMDFIMTRFENTLRGVQVDAGVAPEAYVTMKEVTQMDVPKIERKPQLRAAIVAGAAGLLATLLLTAAVDAGLRARSRRRTEREAEEAERDAADTPAPPATATLTDTEAPSRPDADAVPEKPSPASAQPSAVPAQSSAAPRQSPARQRR
jgi:hypothetical protein